MRATLLLFFISMLLMLLISAIIPGCTSTKKINKVAENKDSLVIEEYKQRLEEKEKTIAIYEQQIKELQYASVNFDSKCDTVINTVVQQIINSGCPQSRIDSFLNSMKQLRNKIKILADGSIEAEGNIKNATSSKEKLQQEKSQLQYEKQLLKDSLAAMEVRLTQSKISKQKDSKTKFLNQWWLFPAGMLFMFIIFYRKKILQLLRKPF